jgi:hypothetical protein
MWFWGELRPDRDSAGAFRGTISNSTFLKSIRKDREWWHRSAPDQAANAPAASRVLPARQCPVLNEQD